jgi:hypothetical protein
MAKTIPVGAVHTSCPKCGHTFRRPLTDAGFRTDIRIHEENSEKHKRIMKIEERPQWPERTKGMSEPEERIAEIHRRVEELDKLWLRTSLILLPTIHQLKISMQCNISIIGEKNDGLCWQS